MAFTANKGDKNHLTNQKIKKKNLLKKKKKLALTKVKEFRDKGKKGCEFVKSLQDEVLMQVHV